MIENCAFPPTGRRPPFFTTPLPASGTPFHLSCFSRMTTERCNPFTFFFDIGMAFSFPVNWPHWFSFFRCTLLREGDKVPFLNSAGQGFLALFPFPRRSFPPHRCDGVSSAPPPPRASFFYVKLVPLPARSRLTPPHPLFLVSFSSLGFVSPLSPLPLGRPVFVGGFSPPPPLFPLSSFLTVSETPFDPPDLYFFPPASILTLYSVGARSTRFNCIGNGHLFGLGPPSLCQQGRERCGFFSFYSSFSFIEFLKRTWSFATTTWDLRAFFVFRHFCPPQIEFDILLFNRSDLLFPFFFCC